MAGEHGTARRTRQPLREEVGALAGQMLITFELWMLTQPDGVLLWTDYEAVNAALDERYQGSFHAASVSASRLALAAERGPYAGHLVSLFDSLAEAWVLDGGAWRERKEGGR